MKYGLGVCMGKLHGFNQYICADDTGRKPISLATASAFSYRKHNTSPDASTTTRDTTTFPFNRSRTRIPIFYPCVIALEIFSQASQCDVRVVSCLKPYRRTEM